MADEAAGLAGLCLIFVSMVTGFVSYETDWFYTHPAWTQGFSLLDAPRLQYFTFVVMMCIAFLDVIFLIMEEEWVKWGGRAMTVVLLIIADVCFRMSMTVGSSWDMRSLQTPERVVTRQRGLVISTITMLLLSVHLLLSILYAFPFAVIQTGDMLAHGYQKFCCCGRNRDHARSE